MPVVLDHEKVFEHYLDLPADARIVVIDEMEPEERCRFAGCSRLSHKETRASKNLVYQLSICGSSESVTICVHFTEPTGFQITFENEAGTLSMKYSKLYCKDELWEDKFYNIPDWVQFVVQHFKNLLQKYQNRIKVLYLGGLMIGDHDFELRSLNRIEELIIFTCIDPAQFLSKLRHPLKNLCNWTNENSEMFKNSKHVDRVVWKNLYTVSNDLILPHLQLNYEQFQRLSASNILINIGELTVENIVDFIRSWQNGTLRDSFRSCQWNLRNSNFDKNHFFNAFKVNIPVNRSVSRSVKHEKEATKTASWKYKNSENAIMFEVHH